MMEKYLMIPAADAAKYEAVKHFHSQSITDHSKKLQKEKDSILAEGATLPIETLLQQYTDALQKFQAYIESLSVEKPKQEVTNSAAGSVGFETPPESLSSKESVEEEETISSGKESNADYEPPRLETFPKSRQALAENIFQKMLKDPELQLRGKEVFLRGVNIGSSRNLISYFVQNRNEKPIKNVIALAKHWVKNKMLDVDSEIENLKLRSILSPTRSPLFQAPPKKNRRRFALETPKSKRQSGGGGFSRWTPIIHDYFSLYR